MINITGHTGLTGLLGSPVAHSVSPLMHNEAFRYLGLDYVYLCFDVTEETLPQAVEGLKACGIKGFNLTMPNKNKIVELLDEINKTGTTILMVTHEHELVNRFHHRTVTLEKGRVIRDTGGTAHV